MGTAYSDWCCNQCDDPARFDGNICHGVGLATGEGFELLNVIEDEGDLPDPSKGRSE